MDLIVIGDWQQGFLDRIKVLLEMNEFGLPLEPIGYTEDEFKAMARGGKRFIAEIIATGKTVYSRRKDWK